MFIGDGFLMVGVILSATSSPVSSLLWLLLLIPAFFFFGKGFADVLHAQQFRRRLKQQQLNDAQQLKALAPPGSIIEAIKKKSGELVSLPSVTEEPLRANDAVSRDLRELASGSLARVVRCWYQSVLSDRV